MNRAPEASEASAIRLRMLEIMHKSGASHIGTCLSVIELLLAVYGSIDTEKIARRSPDRDRVVVSKGHAAAALYAVLNHFKLLEDRALETYYRNESALGGHVTACVSGVEHSTGALGHGLSAAVGMAIGLRVQKLNSRVFVIVGDGELHEGSNWEAMHSAAHLGLNKLCLLVDYNQLSGIGKTNECCNLEPLKEKLESFGFETYEVDGHSARAICLIIQNIGKSQKPIAIICHTIKGKGVSFMENNNVWHYRPLNKEDYEKAILELKAGADA